MKKGFWLVVLTTLLVAGSTLSTQSADYQPKRVNKVIELLESGQPVYYTTAHGGYAEGKQMARTWADYITYEMEHNAFDVAMLREFMRGLVDGGPTASRHRTPTVICTLPVGGIDEVTFKANYWMVQQVLAAGVHGILLCHARSPEAVRLFVQAARYPFHRQSVGSGLGEGLRGSGGQGFAAQIWGVDVSTYLQTADPWPLNPKGEIFLGLKIEDRHALANAEILTRIPGVGFAEWGPGDMGMSLGFPENHDEPYPEPMAQARTRIQEACKNAGISFLNTVRPANVEQMIDEGVRIGSGNQESAEKGRRHTRRQMPW